MLAKAIATGFNSPFVSIPGSGFAATFIGIDAIVVRYLAWKAKRLARKWGGQCIVFIDEIDAVGMRRQALGGGAACRLQPAQRSPPTATCTRHLFFGPFGALNPSGDLILETRAWRERLFDARAPTAGRHRAASSDDGKAASANFMFPGGMGGMGGGMALNQLLVVMDGIDNPPFFRRVLHEPAQHAARRDLHRSAPHPRQVSCALPAPRPRKEQIYFIGATNVPIDRCSIRR